MKHTMQDGFTWEVVTKKKAIELLEASAEVYKVYNDGSESLIDLESETWDISDINFYAVDENTARIFKLTK